MNRIISTITPQTKEENIQSWLEMARKFKSEPTTSAMAYTMIMHMLKVTYQDEIDKDVLTAVNKEFGVKQKLGLVEYIKGLFRR